MAITVCKNQKEMKVRTTKTYVFCSMKMAIFGTIFKILNSVKKSKDTNICLDPLRGLNPGSGFDNLKPQNSEKFVTESCNGGCMKLLGTDTANRQNTDKSDVWLTVHRNSVSIKKTN